LAGKSPKTLAQQELPATNFPNPVISRMKRQTKSSIRTVAIVGVGLIGGSLGLAVKQRYPRVRVVGCDRKDVLRKALRKKAIDVGQSDLRKAVVGADLIVLATPISTILSMLPLIVRFRRRGSIVTDVGSVKAEIVKLAGRLFTEGMFVGGHPMAGVEFSGVDAAHPLLFENAVYILSPAPNTKSDAVRTLSRFLGGIGARVLLLDAGIHDRVASAVSHLPQLAAVALMNTVGRRHEEAHRHLRLAAGGFRDMTRIASSRYGIWKDIIPHNHRNILHALDLYIATLRRYASKIKRKDGTLSKEFSTSRSLRNRIPRLMKGFVVPLADLFVFMPDRPGQLARLTSLLARARINIQDIELLKIREGTGGTFRLSFADKETAQQARKVLAHTGFRVEE
jgi:prephenate dehydrogenase